MIASGPGSRNVADVTSVPSRIVVVSRASPASVIHESVGPGKPADVAHLEVVVAAEEGAVPELLGAQGNREQVVVGGALLGLGEDAEVGEVHGGDVRCPYPLAAVSVRCRCSELPRLPPKLDALRDARAASMP